MDSFANKDGMYKISGVAMKLEPVIFKYLIILIRLMVGAVFLTEGIQKFLYPDTLGIGRFSQIGIPYPEFSAPFVGIVEIICGTLVLLGLFTRLASIPLLINISVAIWTTKIPMLFSKGFWPMAHEARTDFCMFLGCIFLIFAGSGFFSLDSLLFKNTEPFPRSKDNL